MKRIVKLLCLSIMFSSMAIAQNIEKHYTSSVRGEESVYFIYPMEKFKSKDAPKELAYDITYNHIEDSITYNFTFYQDHAFSIDKVVFIDGEKETSAPAKILFIEPKKNVWVHRISLRIPYETLKALYSSSTPYQLRLEREDETLLFELKEKEWKKQSSIINKIIQVIELNLKR